MHIAYFLPGHRILQQNGGIDGTQILERNIGFQPDMSQIGHTAKRQILLQVLLSGFQTMEGQELPVTQAVNIETYGTPGQMSR